MRKHGLVLFVLAAVLVPVGAAWAETAILVTKRLHPESRGDSRLLSQWRLDGIFRMSAGQQVSSSGEYSACVTREPAEFHSSQPFRGVAELGEQGYGFVVDAVKARKYNLLRFDLNHNGDLTDDGVIEGRSSPYSATRFVFPPLEVTLEIGGEQKEYAFFLCTDTVDEDDPDASVYAELHAAAYREGVVTLAGKCRRVVLVDYNGNGRFDDQVPFDVQRPRTRARQSFSLCADLLFIDPRMDDLSESRYGLPVGDDRQFVSRLACVDGRLYELSIDPGGERIDFTPTALPHGRVENPNAPWRALIIGDQGLLALSSPAGAPVEVPAGEWRLVMYVIDLTERPDPAAAPARKSFFATLFGSGDDEPRPTWVSAFAPAAGAPVQVNAGETVRLPFGPPFRGVVTASRGQKRGTAFLELSIVGAAGESCSDLRVKGRRPGESPFVITTPDGAVVQRGEFECG